ncbi:cytotoxic translational repressor of toxin-antitoxin stability system [Ruania albidiflava]|uniref:cytotoxic translational repressor of toxin-antitoxin stability system n=1 Tax=Ruania albidiflava TaxID=366586 RepID=UPI0023F0758A|nr:cytotoxic translational repressor of toxin-antitoxin stability system [Ruania albidiflava]
MNPGSRRDHNKFCTTEGWTPVSNARGGRASHHATYELGLPDGRILRTRISHPVNATTYGAGLWAHILRDQLDVTETEFWACVKDGSKPSRGSQRKVPEDALPVGLAWQLIHSAGVPEEEVARMTRDEAIVRMNAYWAKPPQ